MTPRNEQAFAIRESRAAREDFAAGKCDVSVAETCENVSVPKLTESEAILDYLTKRIFELKKLTFHNVARNLERETARLRSELPSILSNTKQRQRQ